MYKKKEPIIEAFQVGIEETPVWFSDKIQKGEAMVHPGDPNAVPDSEKQEFARVLQLIDVGKEEPESGYSHASKGDFIVRTTFPDGVEQYEVFTEKEFHNNFQLIK